MTQFDARAGSLPYGISVDTSGNIWFGEIGGASGNDSRIARLDPSGHTTETLVSAWADIVDTDRGPDGALWFSEQNLNLLGRIGSDGSVTELAAPSPAFLANGPDGALWFASGAGNAIGRVKLS